jgi:CRISPR-associated protein Csd1
LREYWKSQFYRDFSARNDEEPDDADDDGDEDVDDPISRDSICLITGAIGQPIARSHNPKIRGVPFLTQKGVQRSNGRIVSFNRERPAFSSYGFSQGANAPVSQDAAASYALALNAILRDENSRFDVGPLALCIWAKETPQIGSQFKRLLEKGFPEHVQDVFSSLYAGVEREKVRKSERLHTIAITCATKARVAIKYWLDLPLVEAELQFAKWWDDLRIVSLSPIPSTNGSITRKQKDEPRASPYGLRQLVMTTVRKSKDHKDDKLVGERIVQLYRAALEGTAPSIMLLKPILDEFHTALVKDDAKKPTFPFSQSRFALIKLILLRNIKEGGFMPTPQLADTPEQAYNLGRLLGVFESLQDRYHDFEKKGAGVVERYYGTASSAPAAVFPQLCKLARHHLSKVRKDDESAANRLDEQIGAIMKKFQPDTPGAAPHFKRMLTLPEQGIFALGFYQQRAYDRACSLVLSNLGKARELRKQNNPHAEPLAKARDFANDFGYADLIAAVNGFDAT